jgi:hypothetical protein
LPVIIIAIGLLLAAFRAAGQPVIALQPQSRLVSMGADVTFAVSAIGFDPIHYQWQRNGTPLTGATNDTLTLTNVQPAQAGDYTVVVIDALEIPATSETAILTVDPAFTKITTGGIVTDGGSSYGCAWGDYDNDGFIDLVVVNGWGERAFLYRNNRDGSFSGITSGPIVEDSVDSAAVVWGDYDNDGFLDLFVGNTSPLKHLLFRNRGNGTFAKITSGSIPNDTSLSLGAAWADYDRDGWLDLFVANAGNQNDFLYHGNGDGTFTRITSGPVVTSGGASFACAWQDVDSDGDPDLVVANFGQPTPQNDFLFLNNGSGTFTRITTGPVAADGTTGTALAWGDYDNDGRPDLVVAHVNRQNPRLNRNLGAGNFELIANEISAEGYSTFGCIWGDYDNDGWLDLFVSGAYRGLNRLYRNRGNGTFEVVSNSVITAEGGYGFGCAWGDYNNDGFLDLFVANTSDVDFIPAGPWNNDLYRNNGNTNHWLMFRLIGSASNRSAIGAKVRLQATIADRTFWQMREISGGSGSYNQNDMRPHFGLGDATNATVVRIEWPSGTVQELRNVAANRILTVKEPPVLTAVGRTEVGAFRLSLKGGRGLPYTVDYSSNLTHWRSLTNLTATNVITSITDLNATSAPTRFYRAWEGD